MAEALAYMKGEAAKGLDAYQAAWVEANKDVRTWMSETGNHEACKKLAAGVKHA